MRDRLGALDGGRVEDRVQQFVEALGTDPAQRFLLVDDALAQHLHRDAHHRRTGALAVAGLQHPQAAFLDGELDVLHVRVVLFELLLGRHQLLVNIGHQFFERGELGAPLVFADLRQLGPAARTLERHLLRRADAGDHVFTLRVDQEFAVEQVFAGTGIAGEGNTGAAVVAEVAEHHGLHVHRGTPGFGNVVQLAIDLGAVVVPALEHRHHRAPQLLPRIGRELAADTGANQALETLHQFLQVIGVEFGIELDALLLLHRIDDHLERIVIFLGYRLEAHDHVAVHLHEAAVGVPGESFVARLARQPGHRLVIEAEVEDGVHHAGHRGARTGAHRQQQRIGRIAELLAHLLLDERNALEHFGLDQLDHGILAFFGVDRAHLGADREAGRHRNSQATHFRKVGTLASEEILHLGVPVSSGGTKHIDVLGFSWHKYLAGDKARKGRFARQARTAHGFDDAETHTATP